MKWHSWESDYMKADLSYLIHLSKSASDHKYFVGVFTGRLKILYILEMHLTMK